MEELNLNEYPQPAPAAPQAPSAPKAGIWVKVLTVFFGLSLLAAFLLIARGSGHRKSVKSDDGAMAQMSGLLKAKQDGVGWIYVRGVIMESSEAPSPWERPGASQLARRIRALAEQKEVKAIVLDINSPGGTVAAVQEIYDAIQSVRAERKKPVVALFRDVAASGGYYIASACDKIVAYPGTLTGSIGVIMMRSNYEGLFQKIGLKMEPIKSGRYKDLGAGYRPMTEEERKLLQSITDDSYEQFCAAVKDGRKMSDDDIKEIAEGRIFTGRQALKLRLVDALGNSQTAADLAAQLGGLGKNPKIIRELQPWAQFLSAFEAKFGGDLLGMSKITELRLSGPAYLWMN